MPRREGHVRAHINCGNKQYSRVYATTRRANLTVLTSLVTRTAMVSIIGQVDASTIAVRRPSSAVQTALRFTADLTYWARIIASTTMSAAGGQIKAGISARCGPTVAN